MCSVILMNHITLLIHYSIITCTYILPLNIAPFPVVTKRLHLLQSNTYYIFISLNIQIGFKVFRKLIRHLLANLHYEEFHRKTGQAPFLTFFKY